jgi:hypothetical protein
MSRATRPRLQRRAFASAIRLTLLSAVVFSACGDGEEIVFKNPPQGPRSPQGGEDAVTGGKASRGGNGSTNGGTSGNASGGRAITGGAAGDTGTGNTNSGGLSGGPGVAGAAGNAGMAGDSGNSNPGTGGRSGGGDDGGEGGVGGQGGSGGEAVYLGPSVGRAQTFAVLAYSQITSATPTVISGEGELGVSSAAVSAITDFPDGDGFIKYGNDSPSPNSDRSELAQQDVTALVGDIEARACDYDYTATGMTGDQTLLPGVSCMNSFVSDTDIDGIITFDAQDDPNAFFIVRGNLALNVALGTQIVLANGAQSCSIFWEFATAVTVATGIDLMGNIIAGSAITFSSGATLMGRTLAQTEGVQLDGSTITIPVSGEPGSDTLCSHDQ